MDIQTAQNDLRKAYGCGGFGALTSGLAWVASGLTAHFVSFQTSLFVFFFGGMLIYPASLVLSKLFIRDAHVSKDNPLMPLGLQVTILLFVGLFLAFWLCRDNAEHFYALMLLIIGARYIPFTTLYGARAYWVLGMVLIGLGFTAFYYIDVAGSVFAMVGGAVEIVFAAILLRLPRAKNTIQAQV